MSGASLLHVAHVNTSGRIPGLPPPDVLVLYRVPAENDGPPRRGDNSTIISNYDDETRDIARRFYERSTFVSTGKFVSRETRLKTRSNSSRRRALRITPNVGGAFDRPVNIFHSVFSGRTTTV